jgi:uncharacterized membrane-anchored protein
VPNTHTLTREIAVKVPRVIALFWLIKILSTSVGESFADYLNEDLGLGLNKTALLMSALMCGALVIQVSLKKYVPAVYWSTVGMVSITGTLITDYFTDGLEIPLITSAAVFSVALAVTFAAWWKQEKTLEMKDINNRSREIFYWVAILFTFALGTAVGDLVSEEMGLGYAKTALLAASLIAVFTALWRTQLVSGVLAFWMAYILTRPLGASIGDLLTQAPEDGGLGISTSLVSQVFFAAMLASVVYLSIRKIDRIEK